MVLVYVARPQVVGALVGDRTAFLFTIQRGTYRDFLVLFARRKKAHSILGRFGALPSGAILKLYD